MQKQRVDIFDKAFQGNYRFESDRHMLASRACTPDDAHKSTFRIMRENPPHTAM